MGFGFPLMLLGLAGVSIPIVIHLLNRRRFDVHDWGAMQFLQISETTRRRLLLEELLLMALRMGLIAILVFALAAPYTTSPLFAGLRSHGSRDAVLVFDGSASMGYQGSGKSPFDAAKEYANKHLDTFSPGDSVGLVLARERARVVLEPTHDLERVRQAIAQLPPPRGACDWSQAVQTAVRLLESSKRSQKEAVLLTDDQRFSWSDDKSLLRWELLSHQMAERPGPMPAVFAVSLSSGRPASPPNWSLQPLRSSRLLASVGQQIGFRTAFELRGQEAYRPPYRVRLEVDEKPVSDLPAPASAKLEKGQLPFRFQHRFTAPGSHLVSVTVEPDPPTDQRAGDYVIKDHLPGDNRQDFAVEIVPALPVLIVDGDTRPSPKRRGSDFMRDALSPARDTSPVVRVRVVPIQEFTAEHLSQPVGKDVDSKPRALVLANIERLSPAQQEAVGQFVQEGGGVLALLGDRVDPRHYNDELYRGGQGWFPARLEDHLGSERQPERAVSPLPSSFYHPALELFRAQSTSGLADARFPRWWRLTTPGKSAAAVPIALFTNNDPWFVERQLPAASAATVRGRVIVSATPLDNSAKSNLPDLPAFAPLIHELTYYLAGARSEEGNLEPGQPIRYRPAPGENLDGLLLQRPDGAGGKLFVKADAKTPAADENPDFVARRIKEGSRDLIVLDNVGVSGVYRLTNATGRVFYYVVQTDPREADLALNSDEDREKVRRFLPTLSYLQAGADRPAAVAGEVAGHELWNWFFFGVVLLLCSEVAMTRRLLGNR